ncbi:DJ-1/PfpI family protein [Actinopolymorpha singaporensis]
MRRWWARAATRVASGLVILAAAVGATVGVGAVSSRGAIEAAYPHPMEVTDRVRAAVAAAPRPAYDPKRPTAVVLIGAEGANGADVLAPYEVLAASGEFNVYTAAPQRRPLPLTGGLDVVPDHTFSELDQKFPEGVDVVVIPEVPDAGKPSSDPLRDWILRQAAHGATVVGVCVGVELLAQTGLLDHRPATSNWFKLGMGGMAKQYPNVRWVTDVRYVDDGQVITTAAVLSGVDGALRVVERRAGEDAARRAAAAVRWPYYRPGRAAPVPGSRFRVSSDSVVLLNLGYRDPAPQGVVLTGGVGETELASAFRPYTALSFVAQTHTVTLDGGPIRSRHGLTFVPRSALGDVSGELDRLVVPGRSAARNPDPALARAAGSAGLPVTYLHTRSEFAFDGALRDVAATTDVATATWVAKTLEYPVRTELSGPSWPWELAARALVVGIVGGEIAAVIAWVARRRFLARRSRKRRESGTPGRSGNRGAGATTS